MNKERMQILLDTVTAHPDNFDMRDWCKPLGARDMTETNEDSAEIITAENFCGTTMCLAGWAVVLFDGPIIKRAGAINYYYAPSSDPGEYIEVVARNVLGLTYLEGRRLFHCEQEEALDLLRSYIEQEEENEMRDLRGSAHGWG